MNDELQAFARAKIKEGLAKLTDHNHRMFKLMYSPTLPDAPIDEVVDNMPESALDWAMQQVRRSLKEISGAKP